MDEMKKDQLINTRIVRQYPLQSAEQLALDLPQTKKEKETVLAGRAAAENILSGKDKRIFLIVGPCSLHDKESAKEYADRLLILSEKVKDRMLIVMRCYFEKPRTVIGWKGLRTDPALDGSNNINLGLHISREIVKYNASIGLYSGTEYLSTVTPQYFGDFISWACIGARTAESQEHRCMASGLSVACGFKNGTSGDISVAINGVLTSRQPHTFEGVTASNSVAIFKTTGNPYSHIILRGGKKPNYSSRHVKLAQAELAKKGLAPNVVVDCSHGNSQKDPKKQKTVFLDVIGQILSGNKLIKGIMLESHLFEGNQPIKKKLRYGVSITDPCLGWEDTESLILAGYEQLKRKG